MLSGWSLSAVAACSLLVPLAFAVYKAALLLLQVYRARRQYIESTIPGPPLPRNILGEVQTMH